MEYYKKVYKPNNWHYSLQVVIAKDHHFLGTITFYRTIGKENFKYDDIFVLDMLKDHLAYRMEKHQRRGGYDPSKSDAGKGKSGDLRGTDHQHQYAQKTYFKHIPETGDTKPGTAV